MKEVTIQELVKDLQGRTVKVESVDIYGTYVNFFMARLEYEEEDNELSLVSRRHDSEWINEVYLKANDYKHHCIIPTTASWMIPYFPGGYEEANKYTHSSSKRIYPICPYCKKQSKKLVKIGNLYRKKSFQCTCNDNISYGEKFFISFLNQLGIYYIHQYKFKDFNRFYDFYIPSLNVIVEIHGEQHYVDSFGFTGRSLEEEQGNDRLKNYVKIGNMSFDWCDIKLKNKRIKDIIIMKDNKILDIKQSCTYEDVSKLLSEKYQVDILSSEIRKVCVGKYKQYKGFVFKRIA